jgi:hypothetical protein
VRPPPVSESTLKQKTEQVLFLREDQFQISGVQRTRGHITYTVKTTTGKRYSCAVASLDSILGRRFRT